MDTDFYCFLILLFRLLNDEDKAWNLAVSKVDEPTNDYNSNGEENYAIY